MSPENKEDLSPIEEIKKEYLEKIDYFGNRRSKYALYKKFSKKYNLNKRVFLYIINQAHEDVGSPKRYELKANRHRNKWIQLIFKKFQCLKKILLHIFNNS